MIHSRQLFTSPASSVLLPLRRLPEPGPVAILDEPRRSYTLDEAYAYCERMARTRHENVPVASRFLPEAMRPHVLAIYAFARAADDFADEPEFQGQRHSALENWEGELFRTFHGEADHPVFVALREYLPPSETHRYIGMAVILVMRLAAMKWKLRLPTYRTRTD